MGFWGGGVAERRCGCDTNTLGGGDDSGGEQPWLPRALISGLAGRPCMCDVNTPEDTCNSGKPPQVLIFGDAKRLCIYDVNMLEDICN